LTDSSAHESLTLLQITDVHLRASPGSKLLGVDTWHSVNAVLDQALTEDAPDAILVTGDVAHDPDPAVYRRFEDLITTRYAGPVLVLPGNHDVGSRMGPFDALDRLDLGVWAILSLDSHVDDEPQACVDERDFQALKTGCSQTHAEHILVATHHPPLAVDCPWLDKDRIQNADELLEWMSEHSTVRAMVFGHAHQEIDSSYRHIALLGTPSTCIQFAPRSRRFAVDEQKPGYRWLYLDADGTVRSRVCRVDDYPLTIDLSQFKQEN